jgi:glycerophosphoryl diester phosphodiesterase
MKVLAHRGISSSARENTAAAFAAAVELGVDGFETDVRRTKDGVLVLYHDRLLPDGRPW